MDADNLYQVAVTTHTTGFWSWVIKAVTRSKYSHAYIILPASAWPGQTEDFILEAAPGGVRILPLGYWGDDNPTTKFAWTQAQKDLFATEAVAQIGKPYDYLDDLFIGLGDLWTDFSRMPDFLFKFLQKELDDDKHWECAALADFVVSETLKMTGEKFFDDGRVPHQVSPRDLAEELGRRGWL